MISCGNIYNGPGGLGNNGGSCSLGFDPSEPALLGRYMTADTRHPAVR